MMVTALPLAVGAVISVLAVGAVGMTLPLRVAGLPVRVYLLQEAQQLGFLLLGHG